jgi:predicted TIM-barrel fold metal-dependent hydrolase
VVQDSQQSYIAEALADIKIINTHEHIVPEDARLDTKLDFTYLLCYYLSDDMVSAGMDPDDLEAIRGPARQMMQIEDRLSYPRDPFYPFPERLPLTELSIGEKWNIFAPFWERARNTGFARCILIAIRELFDIPDLNADTVHSLSDALHASNKKGWYRHVLQDRAGIEISVNDLSTTHIDRELFVPSVRFDRFVDIRDPVDLQQLEYDTDMTIQSLDDLIEALETDMNTKAADGMVAVKTALAYRRTIDFGEPARHEAERAFNRLFRHPTQRVSWEEAKPLQDYVMHQIVRLAVEYNRPIQVHTGLLGGNGNLLTNSKPALLTNLFLRYPRARFDLFHAGYPYHHELAALAKNFPNVYVDMCWMYMISPWMAARILHEFLDMVPANKILGFGGDFIIVEGSYGHSRLARQVISQVLAERVEAMHYTEQEALRFGRMILRENAEDLFGL